MGNRLSKIYTRTGDDGSTGLGDGSRVAKENLRVEAYGTVDETNSAIGVVLGHPGLPPEIRRALTEIQHDLFDLGGELCIPGHIMIKPAHVDRLESVLDGLNEGVAAAQGVHSARRRPRSRRLSSRSRHLPARRTAQLVVGTRGDRLGGCAQISESAVGSFVRDGSSAGARRRWRSGLAPQRPALGFQRPAGRLQPTFADGTWECSHSACQRSNSASASGRQNRNP